MSYKDFVMWLKGYSQAIEVKPNKKQWKNIVDLLKKVKYENATITNLDINKAIKNIKKIKRKDFPGKPPDIYF